MKGTPIPGIEHFVLEELVTPHLLATFGAELCIGWLDQRLLKGLDRLSGEVGGIAVNNWHSGGDRTESGLREFSTALGAPRSDHKFGRAYDCHPLTITPMTLYHFITGNPEAWPEITVIENPLQTPGWLHLACRWHNRGGIWIVDP